jgi:hypothetical protein
VFDEFNSGAVALYSAAGGQRNIAIPCLVVFLQRIDPVRAEPVSQDVRGAGRPR